MKFTIVTPSYQQGLYLERTIESVLAQCCESVELEYFILDNCSTDETTEVLKKYENHSQIKIITASDLGQADAINQGWALGTGDVFAWLNADDIYLDRTLESVAEYFRSEPHINAIYGEAVYIDEADTVLKSVTNIRDYSKKKLRTHDFITQPATFLRRDVVLKIGELSLLYRYGFDWDYWIRISDHYDFVRVNQVFAGYRVTGENLTTTGKGKRFREMIRIVWCYGGVLGLLQFGSRLIMKYAIGKLEIPIVKVPMGSSVMIQTQAQTQPMRTKILKTSVDCTSYDLVCDRLVELTESKQSGYVIAANVHVVMTAFWNRNYRSVVNGATIVTPDGMPIVFGLRLLGHSNQTRVYGPDLMLAWCDRASRLGLPIYLYGSSWETLWKLQDQLFNNFPGLQIAGSYSPPFRPLTLEEIQQDCDRINASGAAVVFVSLGCPKQEFWMAQNQSKIQAVTIGVGAAFRFHTGEVSQAPRWMMRCSLEWLYRLIMEPGRLWKRYVINNPAFLVLFGWQWLKSCLNRKPID